MGPGVARFSRTRVVAAARSYIGTPYHHQACVRGVGVDCLGLVRGVWRDLYGYDAEDPPAYSRDWAEGMGRETMLEASARHLVGVEIARALPGDVVVFRYKPGVVAKHAGILTESDRFVHAMEGGRVCEVAFCAWWRRRVAAAFSFPGVV